MLYLVASICLLVLTGILVALGVQLSQVIRDLGRIASNVEQMTALMERVAEIVFPGMERIAKKADRAERKIAEFIEDKVNNFKK